jgi:hypothetical protein
MATRTLGYVIIDRQTGGIVGRAKTRSGANRSVDRRDNEHGAYRFYARLALPTEAKQVRAA